MRIILILLISSNYLFTQMIVEKSDLELTNLQVNDMIGVNKYLYVLTQSDNQVALDKLDLASNLITNDFLKEKGIQLSALATLFKSNAEFLWVGDYGKLLKINPITNSVEDYFNLDIIEDSTTYRITSITEDEFGNIYCLLNSLKLLKKVESDNSTITHEISKYYLVKLENNSLKKLYQFEKEIPLFFKMKYHLGKIIVPTRGFNSSLFIIDLKSNNIEELELKKPKLNELEDWENIEEIKVNEFLTINDEIYFTSEIKAGLGIFRAISKINLESKEILYFTLERDKENGIVPSITSYVQNNEELIVSSNYYGDKSKKFYLFENDKFLPFDIHHLKKVKLITKKNYFQTLSDFNRLDFLSIHLRIDRGIYIAEDGTFYGGNGNGLLTVDNFIQPSTKIEKSEIIFKIIPDLAEVKNEMYIESENYIKSFKILDVNSKVLLSQSNLNSNNVNLNLEGLSIGIYFIELETQDGSKVLKFIKN